MSIRRRWDSGLWRTWPTSKQVRDGLATYLRAEADQREKDTSRRFANRQVEAVARTHEWHVVDTAQFLTRKVLRDPGKHTRGTLKKGLGQRRQDVHDEAVDHALTEGWIVERIEPGQGEDKRRFHSGEKKP